MQQLIDISSSLVCSSTIHNTLLPLEAFLEAWFKSIYNHSDEVVKSVFSAKVSKSVVATINGEQYDFDGLLAYFQKESQEYFGLVFETKNSAVHLIDGQKAGLVGLFMNYSGKNKEGGDVSGVQNVIADIITENEGATTGDPRSIWKLDIVKA